MSNGPTWGVADVVNLIEKGVLLITTLVRRGKSPDRVLREITNLTQSLKEGEDAVDRRVDDLFADEPTDETPRGDDT